MIRSYKDLVVWQKGIDLVEEVYRLTARFPNHERYGLTGQIQRAVVSVPSNIAEGHECHHLNEYLQHLSRALASLAEVETQLEIARRLKYVSKVDSIAIELETDALGRQIRSLRNSLENRRQSST
ncbi:MAG: four helix bundle protein [Chloroflexota bacterium]|nr:four helix bundle protein [Chloroflexota bacterium]